MAQNFKEEQAAGSAEPNLSESFRRNFPKILSGAVSYWFTVSGFIAVPTLEEKIILTETIKEVQIESDFDAAILPFIKLTFALPSNVARSFKDDYRNSRIVLSLSKFVNKTGTESDLEPVWTDKKFVVLDPPAGLSDDTQASDPKLVTDIGGNLTSLTVTLFEEQGLTFARSFLNLCVKDVKISDLVQYIISKTVKDKRILIQQPDNTAVIPQVIIPPQDMYTLFEYIHAAYGIYKHGMVVFADFDVVYLHDKTSFFQSPRDKYSMVHLTVNNAQYETLGLDAKESVVYNKDKKLIGVIVYDKPRIRVSDLMMTATAGKDITVNSKSKTSYLLGGGGIESDQPDRQTYYWNPLNNPMFESNANLSLNEGVELIDALVRNSDFTVFTPNRKFHLDYSSAVNKNFNGDYRLVRSKSTLLMVESKRTSGRIPNKFKSITGLTLVRV